MPTNESGGLYAEVVVSGEDVCPVASTVDGLGSEVTDVSRAVRSDGRVVEEFTVPEGTGVDIDANRVFEHDDGAVYRFVRDHDDGCVCDRLGELGHPVASVTVRDGHLSVSIRARDQSAISDAITSLRAEFDSVRLQYLRSESRSGASELVLVDRAQLTDRQREVLTTAYRMGYFDYPREANASEVAESLDIGPSTFMSHLVAAQSKLFAALVD
jgi:hypothetical protein